MSSKIKKKKKMCRMQVNSLGSLFAYVYMYTKIKMLVEAKSREGYQAPTGDHSYLGLLAPLDCQ